MLLVIRDRRTQGTRVVDVEAGSLLSMSCNEDIDWQASYNRLLENCPNRAECDTRSD